MSGDGRQWWRNAVVYQIYPRSFADANGDGVGDLRGITQKLDYLVTLGVDALWLSPVQVSPQHDHGYDVADYRDIDPLFGTLADFDELIAAAHARGLRLTLDLVPNHTSDEHPWFQAALAAAPGSPERERYLFRDGNGPDGSQPPNNWRSVFGGPSWTRVTESNGKPGQWYYHLFDTSQPDLNWRNPQVLAEFLDVLRFWLDRGVDGFRIDVSDGLMKEPSFPDTADGAPIIYKDDASGVHEIYRAFRTVFNEYPGDRMAVIETGADSETVALFLRPDEMQLAFNLDFARCAWDAAEIRTAIDAALTANLPIGAPTTWVIDNHDVVRSVTRYGGDATAQGAYVPRGLHPDASDIDLTLGRRRHRAMLLLMLALPGTVYLYNGQELGLPNVDDLPESALQDPVWERSGHTERGRDGCRVPVPWSGTSAPYGFSTTNETWLPMPAGWAELTVEAQESQADSMLQFYRRALALRTDTASLGAGELAWVDSPKNVLMLSLTVGVADHGAETSLVAINFGDSPAELPASWLDSQVLLCSDAAITAAELASGLPGNTAIWLQAAPST